MTQPPISNPEPFSGPWGVDIAQPEPGNVRLTDQLAVFAKPRRDEDKLSFSEETPADMASGKELFDESRFLLPEGLFGTRLFGVPTANGWVCPYDVYPEDLEPGNAGPCWYALRDGIAFSLEGEGSVYRLYGVAGNDVDSVSVVADDQDYRAEMGRNAFAFEMKSLAVCPADIDSLLVHHKGGRTSEVELSDVAPPLRREAFGCS